jgi:multidrug efflux pump subunit AcrA (membrane-fusion protein)
MKPLNLIAVIVVAIVAAAIGWFAATQFAGQSGSTSTNPSINEADGPCPGGAAPSHWKALMDPTYVRNTPGKSPMGMDLVPVCPGAAGGDGSRIRVESAVIQSSGVRTARVERRDLARKIRTVGRIDYDERRVTHVHTKFQGWIEKLYVDYEGQMVEKGQPLLDVYSPELVSTQEELLLAQKYREMTGESSFDDISKGGESLFRAARMRLELWDIPETVIERLLRTGEVRKTLTLYAHSRGVVTTLMAREGMEIGPNMNLYTIADLSRVWLYADIYEYELPWIRVGQHGVAALSYLPGKTFEGVVTYVYPFLDAKTRTARARLELENPDLALKPEMFANVTIETDVRAQVLAVPEEAVIRSGRRNLVVVSLPGGYFEPRDVEIGIDSGDGWLEVKSGVSEGELVVKSGQFLLDSESKLQEAVQKFLSSNNADDDSPHAEHSMPAADE